MGKRAKCIVAVKRAFIPVCGKKSREPTVDESNHSNHEEVIETPCCDAPQLLPPPPIEEQEVIRKEHEKNRNALAFASAVAAEAAAVAAQAAADVARLADTTTSRVQVRLNEDTAAIRIQTVFRGYQTRRAVQGLKGLVRLKAMVNGAAVRQQVMNALHTLQTMSRVESQIRSRRARMREKCLAPQRQPQLNHERKPEKPKVPKEWDGSFQSKEQIEARLLYKQEASVRRKKSLAYALSHQWKSSSRAVAPMFTDTDNPQWGWSWLEHSTAVRPWESLDVGENDDCASKKNVSHDFAGQTTKTNQDSNTPALHKSRPSSPRSPATPPTKPWFPAGKTKPISPRGGWASMVYDSRNMTSLQSDHWRRHSFGGDSEGDDDSSVASSAASPGYMTSTESAKARLRPQSPLRDNFGTPEKASIISVKKRMSYPAMDKQSAQTLARARRHSPLPH